MKISEKEFMLLFILFTLEYIYVIMYLLCGICGGAM